MTLQVPKFRVCILCSALTHEGCEHPEFCAMPQSRRTNRATLFELQVTVDRAVILPIRLWQAWNCKLSVSEVIEAAVLLADPEKLPGTRFDVADQYQAQLSDVPEWAGAAPWAVECSEIDLRVLPGGVG